MSSTVPITHANLTAPTPQNTPLTQAPLAAGLSRPTVPDITEDHEPGDDDEESAVAPGAAALSAESAAGGAAVQSAMLNIVQGRLATLVGKSSGYIENLPVEVKRSVEALKGVQVKQNHLKNQYKLECLELEKKVCPRALYPSLMSADHR
jgi:nucleosome assembly protein 1-like 1